MKKVLVTGGSGFVGCHSLPSLLKLGYEIHLAVPPWEKVTTDYLANSYVHPCNILDDSEIKKLVSDVRPSHLLHFAWYAEHGKYWSSPENLLWVKSGIDLVRTFTDAGGARALCVGSCAEYDWSYGFCSEKVTPLNPATLYGRCKNSLRSILEGYAELTDLSLAWGRLFFLYGPGEHPDRFVPSILMPLLRGEPTRCFNSKKFRDYLYVRDAADALVALLDSTVEGAVNIASGIPVSLGFVAQTVANVVGRPDLIAFEDQPATASNPEFLCASSVRINQEVNWQPQFDWEQGIRAIAINEKLRMRGLVAKDH